MWQHGLHALFSFWAGCTDIIACPAAVAWLGFGAAGPTHANSDIIRS